METVTPSERDQVRERSDVSAGGLHAIVRRLGEEELERKAMALAFSAVAAGMTIGFSLVAQAVLQAHLPETQWKPLVVRLGYPVGFLLVILGKQQLFTENTLTPVLPVLTHRTATVFQKLLRLWGIVLAGNLVGAHLMAWLLAVTPAMGPSYKAAMSELSLEMLGVDPWTALVRGVFAGWLIAMVAWLRPSAPREQIPLIAVLTYLVAAGEFTHVVAGAVEALYPVMTGEAPYLPVMAGWIAPTLAGNVLGGVTFVAALNHAQVFATDHS
ncbi:MAG: formate/nitrite transporter family protein [Bryobacteraceae bacterium]|nr:formate/nitrite transporter family protein [Bryobacteraceae bacterium]